jgi:hypothetical protein
MTLNLKSKPVVLHLCIEEKFIPGFYEFIKENFDEFKETHFFYISWTNSIYNSPEELNVFKALEHIHVKRYYWLICKLHAASRIIIHGIWDYRVLEVLAYQPWLLKKCAWVIWGADLYHYTTYTSETIDKFEKIRRFVIPRFGILVSQIRGDYELAKKWYGARGKWHESFMYPSNLFTNSLGVTKSCGEITILIGNSAASTGNHIETIELLRPYANQKIRILCPLSYGEQTPGYKKAVVDFGKSVFGVKFVVLEKFIAFDDYVNLLRSVDVGFFNTRHQQAMGNITTLLGFGKKVYLNPKTTQFCFFKSIGVQVFDIFNDPITIDRLASDISTENQNKIKNYFSRDNLVQQLENLFS